MAEAEPIAASPRIRILIGDSEEVIARTLAVILDLAGCQVCALYTGEAVMHLLNMLGAGFDVIDLSAREPAVQLNATSPIQVQRCKVLLFSGQTRLYDRLQAEAELTLPFELLLCPIRTQDLLTRLRASLCSNSPPLLVPFETAVAKVH